MQIKKLGKTLLSELQTLPIYGNNLGWEDRVDRAVNLYFDETY